MASTLWENQQYCNTVCGTETSLVLDIQYLIFDTWLSHSLSLVTRCCVTSLDMRPNMRFLQTHKVSLELSLKLSLNLSLRIKSDVPVSHTHARTQYSHTQMHDTTQGSELIMQTSIRPHVKSDHARCSHSQGNMSRYGHGHQLCTMWHKGMTSNSSSAVCGPARAGQSNKHAHVCKRKCNLACT
jgi:hypothetical protein